MDAETKELAGAVFLWDITQNMYGIYITSKIIHKEILYVRGEKDAKLL